MLFRSHEIVGKTRQIPIITAPVASRFEIDNHSLQTGDQVIYRHAGTTPITGLTAGESYHVERIDRDTFSLITSAGPVTGLGTSTLSGSHGFERFDFKLGADAFGVAVSVTAITGQASQSVLTGALAGAGSSAKNSNATNTEASITGGVTVKTNNSPLNIYASDAARYQIGRAHV